MSAELNQADVERAVWQMSEPSAASRAAAVQALAALPAAHPAWLAFNWVLNKSLAAERAGAAADGTRYARVVALEELQYALAQLWLEGHSAVK